MKKSIIIFSLIVFLSLMNSNFVLATSPSVPCSNPPSYVNDLSKYYENVKIVPDSCHPGFSFNTPVSYSKFSILYRVDSKYISVPQIFSEFNTQIKETINRAENCQGFRIDVQAKYHVESLELLSVPLYDYAHFESCDELGTIRQIRTEKLINDYLSSQNKFGDYSSCAWSGNAGDISGSSKNTDELSYISFYVFCDHVKESMLLLTQNNIVKESYFQNSAGEKYRRIYPDDMLLQQRNPIWETGNVFNQIGIPVLVIILLVIFTAIVIFIRKSRKSKDI